MFYCLDGVLWAMLSISHYTKTSGQIDTPQLDFDFIYRSTSSETISESFRCSLVNLRLACTCAFWIRGTF